MRELQIIDTLSRQLSNGASGLGDDCYYSPQTRQVLSVDCFVEEQHFSQRYFTPHAIGWKTAAAAISDIAAMGGNLDWLLVGLCLPDTATNPANDETKLVSGLYEGIQSLLNELGQGQVIGGDTVRAPQLVLSHTVIGHVPAEKQVGLRSTMQAGDVLLTTGPHGLSAVGLWALQHGQHNDPIFRPAIEAHLYPIPQLGYGQQLSGLGLRYALMDSSDGLADAALKLASASGGLRVLLDAGALAPHRSLLAYEAATGISAWQAMLYGGEDFELLAAMAANDYKRLKDQGLLSGWQRIGYAEKGFLQDSCLQTPEGKRLSGLSLTDTYQHFTAPLPEEA